MGVRCVPGGALVVAPISWQRGEVIGTGSFGRVHFGLNTASGELMAVKQIAYGGQPTDSVRQTAEALQREVRCLQGLSHENIVRYLGIERDDVHGLISIFLEYCAGGSIASLLERFGCFQETLARSYAFCRSAGSHAHDTCTHRSPWTRPMRS